MSARSKIVFGLSCLTSAGIIGFVHFRQIAERKFLHDGAMRDESAGVQDNEKDTGRSVPLSPAALT